MDNKVILDIMRKMLELIQVLVRRPPFRRSAPFRPCRGLLVTTFAPFASQKKISINRKIIKLEEQNQKLI